jgi:ferredoxin
MLFYFTATGNSLYVAKKIDKNPISIPQALRHCNHDLTDKTIGIVCPIFAGEPPRIVVDFMRKATFKTDYFYIIMTYGNDHTDAAEWTERIGNDFGIKIDYINTVKMVDNFLPVFDMNEQMAMDKKVDEQISVILEELAERKCKILESTEQGRNLHARVAEMFKENPSFNNGEQLMIKDDCNGCGICSQVCPVGNFNIKSDKAERKSNTCEFCLACIQNCPNKAIGLSNPERNPNARYRHEQITLGEIIAANNQNICGGCV